MNPVPDIDPVRWPLAYSVCAAAQIADDAPRAWQPEINLATFILARCDARAFLVSIHAGPALRASDLADAHGTAATACRLVRATGVTP